MGKDVFMSLVYVKSALCLQRSENSLVERTKNFEHQTQAFPLHVKHENPVCYIFLGIAFVLPAS